MQNKTINILYWIPTTIIFIFEGVMIALTSHTEMAIEGIRHLGYPVYFGSMLAICKVVGALAIFIPQVPSRIKEWSYAGFGIVFFSAFFSIVATDGFVALSILPIIFFLILTMSYVFYHKRNTATV